MEKTNKNQKGITLIALVITVIVMLIISAVAISAITDPEGIFSQARDAGDNYNRASQNEADEIKDLMEEYFSRKISYNANGGNGEIAAVEPEEKTVTLSDGTGFTGKNEHYTLLGWNTKADGTGTSYDLGQTIEVNTAMTLYAMWLPKVPTGFYYVGGSMAEGVVISDSSSDANKYKGQTNVGTDLTGNQFVWIPVDGTTVKYAKHEYADPDADDTAGSTADTGNGNWKTYKYRKYTDWEDTAPNPTSVTEYGGFYIARYEAGLPQVGAFYDTTNGWSTYVSDKTIKNVTTYTPVSKANNPSWNFIDQPTALTVSANMYSGNSAVTSALVDSYAWDAACMFIGQGKDDSYLTDSISYGNNYGTYTDANRIIAPNAFHAWHVYRAKRGTTGTSKWIKYGEAYTRGNVTLGAYTITDTNELDTLLGTGAYSTTDYTYTNRVEIATGSTEVTKTKNIYDLAGNMYEWTTETGTHNETSETYSVLRGGSFCHNGTNFPVTSRRGDLITTDANVFSGFRPVLYINV